MALSAVPRVVYGKLGASFAVVCKPPGMPMEAAGARALSVERWAQDELGGKRVWLPHRLDAHTSGLLVLAFSRSVCAELSRTLPTWLKRYRLLAEVPACVARPHERREGCKIGSPSHIVGSPVSRDGTLRSSGTITSYLAPGTADRDGRCSSNGCHFCGDQAAPHPYLPPGMLVENVRPPSPTLPGEKTSAKKAITQYQLVHMSPSRRRALYEVELRTGRTHQIRTHFAGAGLPILHDPYARVLLSTSYFTLILPPIYLKSDCSSSTTAASSWRGKWPGELETLYTLIRATPWHCRHLSSASHHRYHRDMRVPVAPSCRAWSMLNSLLPIDGSNTFRNDYLDTIVMPGLQVRDVHCSAIAAGPLSNAAALTSLTANLECLARIATKLAIYKGDVASSS